MTRSPQASWFADDIDRLALPRDPQLSHAPHTPETASQTQEAFYQRALVSAAAHQRCLCMLVSHSHGGHDSDGLV